MNILYLNPRPIRYSTISMPLSLSYSSSILKEHGHNVKLIHDIAPGEKVVRHHSWDNIITAFEKIYEG